MNLVLKFHVAAVSHWKHIIEKSKPQNKHEQQTDQTIQKHGLRSLNLLNSEILLFTHTFFLFFYFFFVGRENITSIAMNTTPEMEWNVFWSVVKWEK